MQWGQTRDGSMILISGTVHAYVMENIRARREHICGLSFIVNQLCDYGQTALFCCARVLDKVDWGVIPFLLISGVWWKTNLKLDVKRL